MRSKQDLKPLLVSLSQNEGLQQTHCSLQEHRGCESNFIANGYTKSPSSYVNIAESQISKARINYLPINNGYPYPNASIVQRYESIYQRIRELSRIRDRKRKLIISPNKIAINEKYIQRIQPYRNMEWMKVKDNNKQYEAVIHPFTMAIEELGCSMVSHNQLLPINIRANIQVNRQKKKDKLKPISEAYIKRNYERDFLNIEKMNIYKEKKNKKYNMNACDVRNIPERTNRGCKGQKGNRGDAEKTILQKEYENENRQIKKIKLYQTSMTLKNKKIFNMEDKTGQKQKSKLKGDMQGEFSQYVREGRQCKDNGRANKESGRGCNHSSRECKDIDRETDERETERGQNETEEAENEKVQTKPKDFKQKETYSPTLLMHRKRKRQFTIPFETYYYRDLIWKVNFSNSLLVQTPIQYQHRIRAFVGRGNNSSMVKGLIKRRIWIAFTDKLQQANFVWTQLKQLSYFKRQNAALKQCQSAIKQEQEDNLVKEDKIIGGILSSNDRRTYQEYFKTYINFEERGDERLQNRSKILRVNKVIRVNQIRQSLLQNHMINNYVIGNKKALFNTMLVYYESIGEDIFRYLPLTFHIKDLEDANYFRFLKYYFNRAKEIKAMNQGMERKKRKKEKEYNAWIVKPGENSNRGKGIQVCLHLDDIKNILKKKQKYYDGTFRTYMVQVYIEHPFLYHKRKFDIRHYMMISCTNGLIKGYWYEIGYIRTTSSQYTLKTNLGKIHLTNDAIQKDLPDYGKYQKGNKLSYEDFQSYLNKYHKGLDFWKAILPKMKKIGTDTIKACSASIDPQKLKNNFQLFGLDFMIDSNFEVWLIEVNSNPCLEISCPLLGCIIPRMIQNTLELTLDAAFPPPVRYTPKGVHYYRDLEKENKFELVYDERIHGLFEASMAVIDAKMLEEQDDIFQDDGEEWQDD